MNGSSRWIGFEIAVVAVVVLAVIVYLCSANAQTAGANGAVPGQGLLAKCKLPNWVAQTGDKLKAERNEAKWRERIAEQKRLGITGAAWRVVTKYRLLAGDSYNGYMPTA